MKKTAFIIVFILAVLNANTQGFDGLGVHVSAHTSYYKYKLTEYQSEKILGLDIGFNYDASINEYMFFRTGLTYMNLGEKITFGIFDNGGNVIGTGKQYIHNYYLSAPFQVYGKINKFWMGVGAHLNYYLNTHIVDPLNDVWGKNNEIRSFMFGIYLAMGVQDKINDRLYYHAYGYYNQYYSSINSINYGVNAGLSFYLYPEE